MPRELLSQATSAFSTLIDLLDQDLVFCHAWRRTTDPAPPGQLATWRPSACVEPSLGLVFPFVHLLSKFPLPLVVSEPCETCLSYCSTLGTGYPRNGKWLALMGLLFVF